ncbi:hypothetical protein [Flagellimonas sp.]|uniref:hypothetical protein n=1 Tax=Flagellimonas sp. TaxID=2058762 RepID=UPI003AB158A7
MRRSIYFLLLFVTANNVQSQETAEKEWMIFTYETDTFSEPKEIKTKYWAAELVKNENTGEDEFLNEPFVIYLDSESTYGSQLETYCLDSISLPIKNIPDYDGYLAELRSLIKKKRFLTGNTYSSNYEKLSHVRIKTYISAIRSRLYICKNDTDESEYGNQIAFPIGDFEVLKPPSFGQKVITYLRGF